MEYNIFRAPIDNDMYVKEEWFRAGYDKTVARAYETHLSCRATRADSHGRIQLNLGDTTGTEPLEKIEIRSRLSLSSPGIQNILSIDAIWTVDPHGLIKIRLNVKKDPEFPDLPRFGLRLFLPDSMNRVSYFGLGPREAYEDKCRSASHGFYHARIRDLHEDYIRPQENGSHAGCEFVSIADQMPGSSDHDSEQSGRQVGGKRLIAFSRPPFSFNASPYSQEELARKAHNYELIPSACSILNLDYKQNGIGSASCGPALAEKYRFNEETFSFEISLLPCICG